MTAADDHLVNVLGALVLGLDDAMRAAMEGAAGMSGAAPAALVALDDLLDGGSVDRLRRAVGLTSSGGVRLVDRLEAEGLVARRPGLDGRSLALGLTAAGRDLAERVRRARAAVLAEAVAGLSAGDRAQLAALVQHVVGRLVIDRLEGRDRGGEPAGGELCRMCDVRACGRPDGRCPAFNTAIGRDG